MVRAIINGNVYNRRIDSNTNNPLVAHDSDEYSTSLGTKTSFHASNRKPKTRGRSFPIPRVTPLSRARGYRINSSIQTRLRLTSRKHARNRGVARLKSAVELVIFCFGRDARMAITLAVVATRNFRTRNFAEHLRGLETPRGLVVPRFPTHLGDTPLRTRLSTL